MREFRYKDYLIQACSEEIKSAGWIPKARVLQHEESKIIEQELPWPEDSRIFKTEEQADDYIVEKIKGWVDRR